MTRAHVAIREILLREWDPIGIGGAPEAHDEYDAYVAGVYRLLTRRAEPTEVFNYLWWVETEHMGLSGDRQRTEGIAQKLAALVNQDPIQGCLSSLE